MYGESQLDWDIVAARVCEVNDANGFDRPTFESIPSKVMFVITELEEARQAVTGKGADPLHEELADTAIRLLHILQTIWPDDWNLRQTEYLPRVCPFQEIERLLWPIVTDCCNAVEIWRHGNEGDTKICLELALSQTIRLAAALGYPSIIDVRIKVEKNAERGHLHGKAQSAG